MLPSISSLHQPRTLLMALNTSLAALSTTIDVEKFDAVILFGFNVIEVSVTVQDDIANGWFL